MSENEAREAPEPQEIIPVTTLEPWQRLPDESLKAYDAFKKYCDLAENRTLLKVAEMLGCSEPNVGRWALRHSWPSRVRAWDDHIDEVERQEAVKARREMRKRQARIGAVMQSVGAQWLTELREWGELTRQQRAQQGLPLLASAGEVARLIDLGARLEARARGEDPAGRFTSIKVVIDQMTESLLQSEIAE